MIHSFRTQHESLGKLVELSVSHNGKTVSYKVEGGLNECFAQNMDGGAGPKYNYYVQGLTSLDVCQRKACPVGGPCAPGASQHPVVVAGWDTGTMERLNATSIAKFDITERVRVAAGLNMGLTFFIMALFLLGSMAVSRDAQHLVVEPIERLTKVAGRLAKSIFSLSDEECASLKGVESVFLEEVISKMSSFFDVKKRKVTWLYSPNEVIWTIDVSKSDAKMERSGKFGRRMLRAGEVTRREFVMNNKVDKAAVELAKSCTLNGACSWEPTSPFAICGQRG